MKFNRKALTLPYGNTVTSLPFLSYKLKYTEMTLYLIPLLSLPGGSEWIIIALVVLLLFGGKKIPELMKGLGKGVRSFKDGLNEATREVKDAADAVNDDTKK